MHGTDMTGHFAGFKQVGSTLQADGEGMELRPPGICLVVCLDAFGGIFLGDGRDDGRIESATEQDTVGDVGHQLALYGGFEGIVHGSDSVSYTHLDVYKRQVLHVSYGWGSLRALLKLPFM